MSFGKKFARKWQTNTPASLVGMSHSKFKTELKKRGVKVPRDFFGGGGQLALLGSRWLRFRFRADEGPVVDISCLDDEFDRWANSTDEILTVKEFFDRYKKKF